MKKFIIILLMLYPLTYNLNRFVYAQNVSQSESSNNGYVTDLELALRLSKETQQEVVLIFSATWCQFCQKLKKDLPQLDNLDNKIICILDADDNKKLSKKFKVKTLPSSFLINSNGDILSTHIGYNFNSYNKWLAR